MNINNKIAASLLYQVSYPRVDVINDKIVIAPNLVLSFNRLQYHRKGIELRIWVQTLSSKLEKITARH